MFGPPFAPSLARIVAHKPEAISEVVRTRARGLDRDCPHGVAHGFQITSHKSEPLSSTRNLLSKDLCRASLGDKLSPDRPEMTVVGEAFLLAREREGLAGAGAGPDRAIIGEAGEPESSTPSAESGKEMTLSEPGEFNRSNIDN